MASANPTPYPYANEKWLPVVGYEGLYEVSDQARVRSLDRHITDSIGRTRIFRGRIKSLKLQRIGRYERVVVSLSKGNVCRWFKLHQVVASAFIGPCPDGMVVCHGNADATDNRASNLRYDTPSANSFDTVRHGTNHWKNQTHCPYGHQLADPNLVEWFKKKGHRKCKSCARTRSRLCKHPDQKPHFQKIADSYYEDIMHKDGRSAA
ncbi:NUMOD4 motif-containing HNH endonuclease [Corynebacterium falsenii]|uniref:NUMOD4 motif-containing HNH endonuclease n=1 Tax=Corynebacterium falsenii TaxID=108486 RepID=UPI001DAD5BD8|nr:NUMOD4 motif-containing HNH endonuclease [Corynebacterium falsenii]